MAAGIALIMGVVYLITILAPSGTAPMVYVGPIQTQLPDGSRIWLSDNGQVTYALDATNRQVDLQGMGYFEVLKDESLDFQVNTSDGSIKVVGTAFEVDASRRGQTLVKVSAGIVELSNLAQTATSKLTAGEQAIFTKTHISNPSFVTEPVAAWRLNPVLIDKQSLKEVLAILEDLYQINVTVEEPAALQCKITFTLNHPPIDILINTLETLLDIEFIMQEPKQYLVRGDGCQ